MLVGREDCQNLDRALSLEWLETNGRGGFSSGTVAGANPRRYHAHLLTARTPPSERFVLVNQLEEWLELDGHSFPLSTNCYPGVVHPSGYQFCTGFAADPWPTWTFAYNGTTIQREILTIHGRDLVIIRWTLLGKKNQRAVLRVRPKLTGRDYHATHHENGSLSTEASIGTGTVAWQLYADLPPIQAFHAGEYHHAPEWYRQIEFPLEQERGLDHAEDWWSPGEFTFDLKSRSTPTLPSPVNTSPNSMSPPSPGGSERGGNSSRNPLLLLMRWPGYSGAQPEPICPSEAISRRSSPAIPGSPIGGEIPSFRYRGSVSSLVDSRPPGRSSRPLPPTSQKA